MGKTIVMLSDLRAGLVVERGKLTSAVCRKGAARNSGVVYVSEVGTVEV